VFSASASRSFPSSSSSVASLTGGGGAAPRTGGGTMSSYPRQRRRPHLIGSSSSSSSSSATLLFGNVPLRKDGHQSIPIGLLARFVGKLDGVVGHVEDDVEVDCDDLHFHRPRLRIDKPLQTLGNVRQFMLRPFAQLILVRTVAVRPVRYRSPVRIMTVMMTHRVSSKGGFDHLFNLAEYSVVLRVFGGWMFGRRWRCRGWRSGGYLR